MTKELESGALPSSESIVNRFLTELEDRTSLTTPFQYDFNAVITLLGVAQRFVFELRVELLAVRKRERYRFAVYTARSLGRRGAF